MSEVEEDEDGLVRIEEVANTVAGVACALKQLHTRQHTMEGEKTLTVFKAARETKDLAKMAGLDTDQFNVSKAVVYFWNSKPAAAK